MVTVYMYWLAVIVRDIKLLKLILVMVMVIVMGINKLIIIVVIDKGVIVMVLWICVKLWDID